MGHERLHATCLARDGKAVLLRGISGSGKSDLALRLLAHWDQSTAALPGAPSATDAWLTPRWRLVADDQTDVRVVDGRLLARSPATIAGRLEVRGVGIVSFEPVDDAWICLVIDLVPAAQVPRMPEPDRVTQVLGITLPNAQLFAFEPSAPLKLMLLWDAVDRTVSPAQRRSG